MLLYRKKSEKRIEGKSKYQHSRQSQQYNGRAPQQNAQEASHRPISTEEGLQTSALAQSPPQENPHPHDKGTKNNPESQNPIPQAASPTNFG